MSEDVIRDANHRMERAVVAAQEDFATLRTGRANPAMLDHINVEYYGSTMPINQVGAISVPEPRQLVITPWDKQALAPIEKAIMNSELGFTPNNDGNVIRLNIPYLTEERRKELIKQLHKKTEDHKVAVRNVRRDVNDKLKHLEKDGTISEDESRRTHDQIQKLTDKFIENIENLQKQKEAELLEV